MMKQSLKILLVAFGILSIYSCTSKIAPAKKMHQPIVQTEYDAKLLEVNKAKFIGKPLKVLLKEIKPEIKRVTGSPTNISVYYPTFFSFSFIDNEEYNRCRAKGLFPTQIRVFLRRNVEHHPTKELLKPPVGWISEYEAAYQNIIVDDIRVRL